MNWIDMRELPPAAGGFSELFYDYVYDFSEVKSFYGSDFRDSHAYENVIRSIGEKPLDRETLTAVLRRQNVAFGVGAKGLQRIEQLLLPNTFAVITGQQAGLFGGPIYTVYKTVTTIKLAERLKAKLPQYNFVPVFWVEGEDHDFAEMNNISVIDAEAKLTTIEYLPGGEVPQKNLGPIGELAFDAALDQTYLDLTASLQTTEFTDSLLKQLRECYGQGRTFNQGFVAWMNSLFAEYGLTYVSSNDRDLKRLLSPLFVKEVREYPAISQTVIARSAELEERYHAQVKPKSVNLFLFHKGGRYLIEPREHDFSLKGTRHFLSKEEMLRIAQETPELLSPNVVLRPIAQDMLFPTVAYVAGPSEIAYHAQLGPVYGSLGVSQPVLYPRASASFVEERIERVMEKYNLPLVAFFDDVNELTSRVLEQISEVKLEQLFSNTTRTVHDALNELKFGLNEVDPTLLGALETARSKVEINIGVLKEKALGAQKRRNETALRQIDRAVSAVLPQGHLQERELSILYFMNKYGPELIKWLMGEMDIEGFKHQLLMI
jgi:bacillithiol biosynthesis cysteine-adding enzyme BshC